MTWHLKCALSSPHNLKYARKQWQFSQKDASNTLSIIECLMTEHEQHLKTPKIYKRAFKHTRAARGTRWAGRSSRARFTGRFSKKPTLKTFSTGCPHRSWRDVPTSMHFALVATVYNRQNSLLGIFSAFQCHARMKCKEG